MEDLLIKSKIIIELEEKIKQGNSKAIGEFFSEIIKEGTPLIESIQGDSENSLVTYIYRQTEDIENILVVPVGRPLDYEESKMYRLPNTDLWYKTHKMNNTHRFSYNFSVNDTLDDDYERRKNNLEYDKLNKYSLEFRSSDNITKRIESCVIMPHAKEHFWTKGKKEISKGILSKHRFKSTKLKNDRNIWVYTPFGYKADKNRYGVLLLTDGGDYINILSGINVLDNLIGTKKIPPVVAVFVDSNDNRFTELTCNDIFVEFLTEEILPWLKKDFSISHNSEETVIGGLSLGALTASYAGLKRSDIFGKILSQSGAYWYKPEECKEENWLGNEFKKVGKLPLEFYLNVGVLEPKASLVDTNKKFRDILRRLDYKVKYEEFESGHDYLSWGETLANGLIALIGNGKK